MFNLEAVNCKQEELINDLIEKYKQRYDGKHPKYMAKAPGRVNLIGEHIDYCGYSVLPMAIEQSIIAIGCEAKNDLLTLKNTNPMHTTAVIDMNKYSFGVDNTFWHKYVMCGITSVTEIFPGINLKGMKLLIHGNIPIGCGLSSSSALVVCSALITLAINGLEVKKDILAEKCAECERLVGVQGGGMDQAISCLADEGEAKFISFNPLRLEPVRLPPDALFVIANSCTSCYKASRSEYNTRVAECRIGSKILAKKLGINDDHHLETIRIPIDVEKTFATFTRSQLCQSTDKLLKTAAYSCEDIKKELSLNDAQLNALLTASNIAKKVEEFKLHDRLLHVYSEAERVECFKNLCLRSDVTSDDLGELMNASQQSCAELFECSCNELDELVKCCRNAGALGSRLTGAGWGGCNVSIIKPSQLKTFMKHLQNSFYKNVPIDNKVFVTKPAKGAYMSQLKMN